MLEFDRPLFLFAAAACIPAFAAVLLHVHNIKLRRSMFAGAAVRAVLWSFAWISAAIALAGPYWGYESVPVPKRGNAVSFVFDISYSMTAGDVPAVGFSGKDSGSSAGGGALGDVSSSAGSGALSDASSTAVGNTIYTGGGIVSGSDRLASAARFADSLLSRMNDYTVSVVLVKGKAMTAVPLTEDFEAVRTLLPALSPSLMTAPGSNPADGIQTAIQTFPDAAAQHCSIIFFTDGGSFSADVENAVRSAVMRGIYVLVIGVGSEEGAYIMSGTGERIHTKLEQKAVNDILTAAVKSKSQAVLLGAQNKNELAGQASFISAAQPNAVNKVISFIGRKNKIGQSSETGYETRPVARHYIFLSAALLFFTAGFVFSLRIKKRKKTDAAKRAVLLVLVCSLFFSSCTEKISDGAAVLQGTLHWHQKEYPQAAASFLKVINKETEKADDESVQSTSVQYALLGLASSYFMQGETDAALEKISRIQESASESLLAAAYYNGALAYHASGRYEKAAEYFRKSLEYDSANIDAKINLELSVQQRDAPVRQSSQEISPVSETETPDMKAQTLFSIIRQNEEKRWKNSAVQNEIQQSADY